MKTKSFKLPAPQVFENLSLLDKAVVFLRWLESRPPKETYNYWDRFRCPLARFGQALHGSLEVVGGGREIFLGDKWVKVFPRNKDYSIARHRQYDTLARAFRRVLKKRLWRNSDRPRFFCLRSTKKWVCH